MPQLYACYGVMSRANVSIHVRSCCSVRDSLTNGAGLTRRIQSGADPLGWHPPLAVWSPLAVIGLLIQTNDSQPGQFGAPANQTLHLLCSKAHVTYHAITCHPLCCYRYISATHPFIYRNTPRHLFKYPHLQKILFSVYTGASVTKTCEQYGT